MNLPPDLTYDTVSMFSYAQHADYLRRRISQDIDVGDPKQISDVAKSLAVKYYRGQFGAETLSAIRAAEYGGLVLYALDRYSCAFEDVCDICGYELTMAIAAISGDNRLPKPQRNSDLRGRIAYALAPAQLVKLAELLVVTRQFEDSMAEMANALDGVENRKDFFDNGLDWLELAKYLCTCMRQLRDNKGLVHAMLQHRQKLKQLILQWESVRRVWQP